ncbi:MAG: hypothetical protein AB7I04_18440 [Pseudomonadales bacterium]
MEGVTVGRLVHFRGDVGGGECRAAIIVREWGDQGGTNGCVNLTVYPDAANDRADSGRGELYGFAVARTSVVNEEHANGGFSWHWPERV